jgi:hypothetical protein
VQESSQLLHFASDLVAQLLHFAPDLVAQLLHFAPDLVAQLLHFAPDLFAQLLYILPQICLPTYNPVGTHHFLLALLQVGIGEASGMESVLQILMEEGMDRRRNRDDKQLQHKLAGLHDMGAAGGMGAKNGAGSRPPATNPVGDILMGLNHSLVSELAEGYLAALVQAYPFIAPDKGRDTRRVVVSKMPDDFYHLGVVRLLFPTAKVRPRVCKYEHRCWGCVCWCWGCGCCKQECDSEFRKEQ